MGIAEGFNIPSGLSTENSLGETNSKYPTWKIILEDSFKIHLRKIGCEDLSYMKLVQIRVH